MSCSSLLVLSQKHNANHSYSQNLSHEICSQTFLLMSKLNVSCQVHYASLILLALIIHSLIETINDKDNNQLNIGNHNVDAYAS